MNWRQVVSNYEPTLRGEPSVFTLDFSVVVTQENLDLLSSVRVWQVQLIHWLSQLITGVWKRAALTDETRGGSIPPEPHKTSRRGEVVIMLGS